MNWNWLNIFKHQTTEYKHEQIERQTAELYKTLTSSSPVGVYIVQQRKFQFVNPQFQKYTSFSHDELLRMDPLNIVYPEDREMARENAVRILKGEGSSAYEFRIITRDRRIRWIMERVVSIPYRGEQATLGSCIDITEQKEALNRLEEMEALAHSVLDAIPSAILVLHHRHIILATDATKAVLGWQPEELIGKTAKVLFHSEEEYEETIRYIESVLERQTFFSDELPCRHKCGGVIMCLVKGSRTGKSVKESKTIVTFEDITERKKLDEELQKQRHELNRRSKELNCLYTISNLVREQDISLEEIAQSIIALIPPTSQYPESICAKLILEGQEFKTGNYQEAIYKQTRDIIVGGKIIGNLAVCYLGEKQENDQGPLQREEVDLINAITTQLAEIISYKRAQETLRNTEANLRHIITNNADGMIVIDKNGVVRFVNPAAEAIFGRKAEKLLNKSFGFPTVAGEKTEIEILRKNSETATAEIRTVEIEWYGESACLASLRDITKRKQIEQLKTDSILLVSNLLQTPMSVINMHIDEMLAGPTDVLTIEQRQYLEEMQEISSRTLHLIPDLLDISRIGRGVIFVDTRPIELKEIVDLAIREHSNRIKEKGLVLKLEETDDLVTVLADKDKMVEALSNVINNAIKFTGEGLITIKTTSENGFGIIEVAGTGKGISNDFLSKIFGNGRISTDSLTSEDGWELGLYIAKHFMELQRGGISATSSTDKGTSYILKIPLAKFEVILAKG